MELDFLHARRAPQTRELRHNARRTHAFHPSRPKATARTPWTCLEPFRSTPRCTGAPPHTQAVPIALMHAVLRDGDCPGPRIYMVHTILRPTHTQINNTDGRAGDAHAGTGGVRWRRCALAHALTCARAPLALAARAPLGPPVQAAASAGGTAASAAEGAKLPLSCR